MALQRFQLFQSHSMSCPARPHLYVSSYHHSKCMPPRHGRFVSAGLLALALRESNHVVHMMPCVIVTGYGNTDVNVSGRAHESLKLRFAKYKIRLACRRRYLCMTEQVCMRRCISTIDLAPVAMVARHERRAGRKYSGHKYSMNKRGKPMLSCFLPRLSRVLLTNSN